MDLVSPDQVLRLDPVFGAMGVEAGRKVWASSRLSLREKTVLLIAGDVTVRELGLPFELHTAMALDKVGMSIEDLREILRHVAPTAGLNPTSRAFERLAAIARALGKDEASREARARAPHPAAPYPAGALTELRAAAPALAADIEAQSAELWARLHLSHRERLFANLAVDVVAGTLGPTFAAHVGMALGAGVTSVEIREALRVLAEYSTARAWEAAVAHEQILRSLTLDTAGAGTDYEPRTVASTVEVARYDKTVLDKADASGLAIVETRLVEKFSGGIIGEGHATHLRLERPDGTGTLICYERITGSLDGRQGSFLLEARGAMEPGADVHGRWSIVDGSGTGELEALRGYAQFSARHDETSPTGWRASTSLTYWLEHSLLR